MLKRDVILGLFCIKLFVFSFLAPTSIAFAKQEPLPVKKFYTIQSTAPLAQLWNTLSEKEKSLAFHLLNAARAGRDLLFFQSHRYSLGIKATLEDALSPKNFESLKHHFGRHEKALEELLLYAAQFEEQGGPYGTSNRKFFLKEVVPRKVKWILKNYGPKKSKFEIKQMTRLLTDPDFEVIRRSEEEDAKDLELAGGNIYEKGITGTELNSALANGLKIDLNCQVRIASSTGKLYCQKLTTTLPGIVGLTLQKIVNELALALPFATTDHQRKEIEYLIQYFESGDIESFRQANIEWVKDGISSKVDFMMGFTEVYDDHLGNVGSWASYVQILEPTTTQISQSLAKYAQYFEDQMPYGIWKKKFPVDYAPPALMVYYFQEIADMRTGGYNLPNYDDIRRDIGFKNIIRLPLPGEAENPEIKANLKELYQAFGPSAKVESMLQYQEKSRRVIVLLHEIIGHGSGTYDTRLYGEKEDPITALASSGGSALEEQRADLAALVFAGDPKLVELGIYENEADAKLARNAIYDIYLVDFLKYLSRERTFSESHMRGHWLLINKLLAEKAIAWESPDSSNGPLSLETQVLAVKNYDLFWKVCHSLLSELQDIKANRKAAQLEELLKTSAPLSEIDAPWVQSIIQRGENLKINSGLYQQGWFIDSQFQFHSLGETNLQSLVQSWSTQPK